SDTLRGGDGNDLFTVWSISGPAETVLIDGGAGDDLIQTFMNSGGNRTLTATGGAGVDTYTFLSGGYTANYSVTDFVAGAGGDRLDVSKLLDYSAADGRGYEGGNPMRAEQGYLRLLQSGADTLLQYDEDGTAGTAYAWHTAITLKNVMATAINAHNFKPLTIEGTAGADILEGGLGVDTLNGGAGDDVLDGNWGDDSMTGGTGNDTYYVDNLGDLVKEVANEGADKVVATIDYVLASNVENLTLGSGAAAGTGNALDNTLTGNATANTLNGGAGADTLAGGLGNDTYVVDNALDVISETSALASEIDTVQSSASWTLGANLERLVLTGAAAINGTGNALNNTLTG
ncbi:MAG TPA: calcium-binding protein, partial [Pseudomonas sp.]|nr:calcium-binding protein [Pseudomonas sp.]